MKSCKFCREEKENSEFHLNKLSKDGLVNYCKQCASERNKRWASSNKEKRKVYNKRRVRIISKEENVKIRLWNLYRLTLNEYNNLLKAQNNKCAICQDDFHYLETQRKEKSRTPIHVDHCHDKNKVRGLLCNKCNVGLGMFKDNIEYLNSAIKYLAKE